MESLKYFFVILVSTSICAKSPDSEKINPSISGCPNAYVKFWLYTMENRENPYLLDEMNISTIENAEFKNTTFKILIHGLGGNRDSQINERIRPEYLDLDYNVITVDYGDVSGNLWTYITHTTIADAKVVAMCLAHFIRTLMSVRGIDIHNIHVLGFSLGAHVAGNAGNILNSEGLSLPRITALDPANLGFYYSSFVTINSAEFVDVIHTDGFIGLSKPSGHVDFYVNGVRATKCLLEFIKPVIDYISRDHNIVLEYYAESIREGDAVFCGRSTTQNVKMGEHTQHTARGIYSVITNDQQPYARDYDCE